ncbi:MAG: hypothetical protein ACOYZ8_07030 [Chloroflexota bacterium]
MLRPIRLIPPVIILILLVSSCNLPTGTPAVQDPAAAGTSAAQTVIAQLTAAAPLATPTSAEPTFTPLPTLTFTPVFTSTPSIPMISVSVATNCRYGPGKVYDYLGALLVGETTEVVARSADGNYWYVRNPDQPGGYCWLWNEYATVTGNWAALPIYTPPPSPTPAPSFDLSYEGLDTCVGWWVELKLKNTGPLTFKSIYMSVKDTVTDVTLTDSANGFEDIDGCLSSGMIASLGPGDSYVVSSPAFLADPTGHKVNATVTLCTLENQGGQCVTQSISFKP